MSKIKEKAPVDQGMKEKVKAAPKELLRRGLLDGTQRLHGQLRDTAQRGQRDGYGGDQIEDAAWRGGRWGERGIEKLLKKKKDNRARKVDHGDLTSPETPPEPPSWEELASPGPSESPTPQSSPERVRIKTREAAVRSDSPVLLKEQPKLEDRQMKQRNRFFQSRPATSAQATDLPGSCQTTVPKERPKNVQIKTRAPSAERWFPAAPPDQKPVDTPFRERLRSRTQKGSSRIFNQTREAVDHFLSTPDGTLPFVSSPTPQRSQPIIKTKDTYIRQEAFSSLEQPSQILDSGRKLFQRKQTHKLTAKDKKGQTVVDIPSASQVSQSKQPVSAPSLVQRTVQNGRPNPYITKSSCNIENTSVSSGKAAIKAARPDTKMTRKTAGRSVKTAEHTSQKIIKSADRGTKVIERTAKAVPQAHRGAVQAVRAAKQAAPVTARGAAKAGSAALRATARAARTLAAALAAGGSVVVSVVLVLCLVGVLVASPFGIFFTDSNAPGTVSPSAAAVQVNNEFSDYLAALQAGGSYDSVEIIGQPPDWSDVFAIFAAKTAVGGVDVVTLDAARVDLLRAVFWDMTKITSAEESVDHPASGSTPAWTESVLKITITARTTNDMRVFYSFTDGQNQSLDALLANGGLLTSLAGDLTISSQDAKALLTALPADLDPERRAVVETACRLVGKVNYFWGGKSRVLGWDERWGQIRKVTASGSSTSGTYRPFGLDCSGFVDWVFYNVTGGSYIIGHGGGAHSQHGYCTAITWDQAIPGDLVFYPGDTHVGIVGGRDESGNLLIIHCTYSKNNVVITGKSGFTSIARPNYYSE